MILTVAIKYCLVHHFADDEVLNYNSSVKRMKEQVNQDIKIYSLNANKVRLNISKAKVGLFR